MSEILHSDMCALGRFRSACAFTSLTRIFTRRILDSQGCKISSWGQRRLRSVCVDTQADLSHRLAHISDGSFSDVAVEMWKFTHFCIVLCGDVLANCRSFLNIMLVA